MPLAKSIQNLKIESKNMTINRIVFHCIDRSASPLFTVLVLAKYLHKLSLSTITHVTRCQIRKLCTHWIRWDKWNYKNDWRRYDAKKTHNMNANEMNIWKIKELFAKNKTKKHVVGFRIVWNSIQNSIWTITNCPKTNIFPCRNQPHLDKLADSNWNWSMIGTIE